MKGVELNSNGSIYSPSTIRSHKLAKTKNNYERKKLDKKSSSFDKDKLRINGKVGREQIELMEKLKQLQVQQHMYGTLQRYPDEDDAFKDTSGSYAKAFKDDKHKRSKSDETNDAFEASGLAYARRRNRRVSKEFEDLDVHTATGTLHSPVNKTKSDIKHGSLPSLTKKSPSKESLYKYNRVKESHWVGEPEAIYSVRRNRKTVEQQKMVTLQFRLSRSESDNKLSQYIPDGTLMPKSRSGSAQSISDVIKSVKPSTIIPDMVLNNGTIPMENSPNSEISIERTANEDTVKQELYNLSIPVEKSSNFSLNPILKKPSSWFKTHKKIDTLNDRSSPDVSSFLYPRKNPNSMSLSLPGSMPGSPLLSRQNDTNPRKHRSQSFNEKQNTFKSKQNTKKVTFCLNCKDKTESGANIETLDNGFTVELPDLYQSNSALLSKRLQSR
ncbi:unnamed protein product [Owenia fusiformis]|uniref:Uncharacterized protein n=1 Tax=Owenia fusiformis TaxID=6347 RepID=A0A8J1UKF5_OWEFU|nr:unnamed protein product [Owenia fusiformis]